METTLDAFQRDTVPTGVFLASYLPATSQDDDYGGESWVGTTASSTPGVIRHSLASDHPRMPPARAQGRGTAWS